MGCWLECCCLAHSCLVHRCLVRSCLASCWESGYILSLLLSDFYIIKNGDAGLSYGKLGTDALFRKFDIPGFGR